MSSKVEPFFLEILINFGIFFCLVGHLSLEVLIPSKGLVYLGEPTPLVPLCLFTLILTVILLPKEVFTPLLAIAA